jgi:hypothetical protein
METAMRLLCRKLGLLMMGLLLAASPLLAAKGLLAVGPAEVKKLHVLLVFDTEDEALGDSLKIDEQRMRHFLKETIPQDRLSLTVLKGKDVSPERILAHYRKVKPDPGDGLMFFYGGHGGTDKVKGHFLQLSCGIDLPRSDLRKAMEAKKTPLVLLVTDCCSTPQKIATVKTRNIGDPRGAKAIHPTVRCLLFQARGTIDVTAATNNASWSDNEKGGLFTRSFCQLMKADGKSLDTNRDGLVSWREFFPRLQNETEAIFKSWSKELRARGARIDTRTQKPSSFSLGEDVQGAARTFAVVGIENGTKLMIAYRWRWSGQQDWNDHSLATGEKKVHFLLLMNSQQVLPELEVEINGKMRPPLKADRWSGEGDPKFDDGKPYRLGPRKKAS